jgi:phage baseplate assembly protein W
MTTFIGFNTQNQYKKFTLTDSALIKRDFLNALNIRQGQVPGRPQVGTILWDNLFDSQTNETDTAITNELQRVAGGDPRIQINNIEIFPQQNGILLQVELILTPSTDAERLSIFFDQNSRTASYV